MTSRWLRRSGRASRWLVDGMNLIGSRPDGWWRNLDAAVTRTIAELSAYAGASNEDVSVVFDGRPEGVRAGAHGSVTVAFASSAGRDAADDEIARMVAEDSAPESIRVVTSDRRLAERVSRRGASVVSASAFRRRLESGSEGWRRQRPAAPS